MQADIKAPRGKDSRDYVRKLTLTAENDFDQLRLSIIAYSLFPFGNRDAEFDAWMKKRIEAFLKEHNLTLTVTK